MLADIKQEVTLLTSRLSSVKQILLLVSENPTLDGLAAALSLYLSLKKSGKQCLIGCPSKLTVEFSDLVGVDEVKSEIGANNFVISINYQDGAIEKVSYNIENGKFNLIIKPKENSGWNIDKDKVEFRKQGITCDLIITVGCASLKDLGKFYTDEQKIYSEVDIVNIDNNFNNEGFGKINLNSPLSLSISELACLFLEEFHLSQDKDVATNLLTGIDSASNQLQSEKLEPDTLQAAAICLKYGGVRISGRKTKPDDQSKEVLNKALKIDKTLDPKQDAPSPDWLTPKIYKGSTLL